MTFEPDQDPHLLYHWPQFIMMDFLLLVDANKILGLWLLPPLSLESIALPYNGRIAAFLLSPASFARNSIQVEPTDIGSLLLPSPYFSGGKFISPVLAQEYWTHWSCSSSLLTRLPPGSSTHAYTEVSHWGKLATFHIWTPEQWYCSSIQGKNQTVRAENSIVLHKEIDYLD